VPLRDGLERTVAWTRHHMERINELIAGHADRMAVPARHH
jgi:hypothetical protein